MEVGSMSNSVLWKRLTETDFNAMHGVASPHGRGGGAMHIALGVRTDQFQIDRFLNAGERRTVHIEAAAEPGTVEVRRAYLTFSSNPNRRNGEWLISDQFSHRHPAWSSAAGFPTIYHQTDPPYVLIFRVGRAFHARFATTSRLVMLGNKAKRMLLQPKGISAAPFGLLSSFNIPPQTLLETFEEATEGHSEPFNPTNIADGRRRVFAAVLRRLGQQGFRRKLLSAYNTQCVVTRCRVEWVLEAAHITPYRGRKTNAVTNGLLLRADIHTLFDLALIAIEPIQLRICVSSLLAGSQYEEFEGRTPVLPARSASLPSPAALAAHYKLFHP